VFHAIADGTWIPLAFGELQKVADEARLADPRIARDENERTATLLCLRE